MFFSTLFFDAFISITGEASNVTFLDGRALYIAKLDPPEYATFLPSKIEFHPCLSTKSGRSLKMRS